MVEAAWLRVCIFDFVCKTSIAECMKSAGKCVYVNKQSMQTTNNLSSVIYLQINYLWLLSQIHGAVLIQRSNLAYFHYKPPLQIAEWNCINNVHSYNFPSICQYFLEYSFVVEAPLAPWPSKYSYQPRFLQCCQSNLSQFTMLLSTNVPFCKYFFINRGLQFNIYLVDLPCSNELK